MMSAVRIKNRPAGTNHTKKFTPQIQSDSINAGKQSAVRKTRMFSAVCDEFNFTAESLFSRT